MMNENKENKKKLDLSIPNKYAGLFKSMSKLSPDGIIKRADCKFCNHPIRADAEYKFEKSGRSNMSLILKFFKEWENENPDSGLAPMNWMNVRTHLLNHYLQQEKKMWLAEYSERMTELMNYKIAREVQFETLANALWLKFHEIGSDPTLDPLKVADTLPKISKAFLEITVTQAKLKGEMESVNIYINKFQNVWSHMVKEAKDPGVRVALQQGLDTFQSQLESTIVPEVE